MYLIDTHAHVYVSEFDTDRASIIDRAKVDGVEMILMPAIDSSCHAQMLSVEEAHHGCLAMMGLHPCYVKENYLKELEIVENYLKERKFVAVGEIGLDFYWDKTFTEQQYKAFHRQIELALTYDLPIVIHSREATDECIQVIRQYPGLRGVFHCFSGTVQQAEAIIGAGFMLGIGGVITFKNSGMDKVIAHTGIEQVILETDAPYLAPVPYRGKRNEPAYTRLVAEKISTLVDKSFEEVAELTTKNAVKLFNLSR